MIRASQGLGASGITTFRKVIMPLILPGMISGALFAFITSLDEVVAVIFLADVDQRTIPRLSRLSASAEGTVSSSAPWTINHGALRRAAACSRSSTEA